MELFSRKLLWDCLVGDVVRFDHIPEDRFIVAATRIERYESTPSLNKAILRSVIVFIGKSDRTSLVVWSVPYGMMNEECDVLI